MLSLAPGAGSGTAFAQGLTGALIGTVSDEHGGAIVGAQVTLTSSALIGGEVRQTTGEKGHFRFPVLPPGWYGLVVTHPGFSPFRVDEVRIGVGATRDQPVRLRVATRDEFVVVESGGSRLDARDSGFSTRFRREDVQALPTPRTSMFDLIRNAPGIAPTSPASNTQTTVSAFGSGTNENLFLIDGTNFTCPCNGIARSEPGIDFIQEIHVQSIGASAEHGNIQGAVINVVTRQGGEMFHVDAAYYGQPSAFTSQPIRLGYASPDQHSGYERARYRDFTTNAGGPLLRQRMWFFAGYQYLRDYASQPGTDPAFPRVYEQNKFAAKLTWKPAPGWQLMHSFHGEAFVSPESPTRTKPIASTQRRHASVPASTFAHLTHVWSDRTVWDVRVGRFVHARKDDLHPGVAITPSHFDQITGVWSGAPSGLGSLTLIRTTAKATVNHFRPAWWGADHQLKYGVQVERGEGHGTGYIPTGVRYLDVGGQPLQSISSEPSRTGGLFVSAAAFVSDAITAGSRLTINVGLRFDHSRAISQDLQALDADGHETDEVIEGLGRLYTWNVLSPRLGVTFKLTADGRTMLRGSYGRFSQGVLTGEFSSFHPGVTPTITRAFEAATGDYTRLVRVVDSRINLLLDHDMRAPRTDEYSIGVDREITRGLAAAVAYVRKRGTDFIGWMDIGGVYREEQQPVADGTSLPVFVLTTSTAGQRFLLTNPTGYSLEYDGLVIALEKRHSSGWQAFGSYTYSQTRGLLASSGTGAAAAQSSTVALPTAPIGRDPNELTNARGRLPNDRPHMFRVMATTVLPRTAVAVAANLQHYSGKPWAASVQRALPQGNVRILIEPPGTRRLSAQTLLDLRVSRAFQLPGAQVEVLLDVLNALNDTAAEGLATDNYVSATFGEPTVFMDPRRVMLAVRLQLGR